MTVVSSKPLQPRAPILTGDKKSQARLYGPEFEFRIVEIEARCANKTWEFSRAMLASIAVAMPACNVIDVRSKSEDTATALVIQSSEAKNFHVILLSLPNQRNEMDANDDSRLIVLIISDTL